MALPTPKDVETLLAGLSAAAEGYGGEEGGLQGYLARVEIISKAKELIRALTTPDQIPNYHGLNVSNRV